MSNCFNTEFASPPETSSPTCTTDDDEIDDFNAKAESLWNWLLTIFKDDVDNNKTMRYFLNELNTHCSKPTDYSSDYTYSKGDLVYKDGYLWRSLSDDNTDTPAFDCALTTWTVVIDNKDFLEAGGRTIYVDSSDGLKNAIKCLNHKKFIALTTIELKAGTYTIDEPLEIYRAGDIGYWLQLRGDSDGGSTIIENGTDTDILFNIRDNCAVLMDKLELKGNGNNIGVNCAFGSIFYAPSSDNKYSNFKNAVIAEYNSHINCSNNTFNNNTTAILSDKNSYLNATNVTISGHSKDDSVGIEMRYNSSGDVSSSTITNCNIGIYSHHTSSIQAKSCNVNNCNIGIKALANSYIEFESSKTDNTNIGIYSSLNSAIGYYNGETTNTDIGIQADFTSSVFASNAKSNASNISLIAQYNSYISATNSNLNGEIKALENSTIMANNATGSANANPQYFGNINIEGTDFTSSIATNEVKIEGIVYQ